MISSPCRPVVLLVEDSDDDAFFFARLLKKCGCDYRYVHVVDGRAALDYLEKSRSSSKSVAQPDLVFLDLKLPAVSGFEILQWIALQKFEPALKVTILSGSDQGLDIERASGLGAPDYLVKPIRLEQLRSRLDAWFRLYAPAVSTAAELV